MKRKALGRGLASLIPESEGALGQSVRLIDINSIVPNPHQPRKEADQVDISSLAESLVQKGMIQPVIVTRSEKGFTLVAGERRVRAAKSIGWKTVPALIKDLSTPLELLELAIIENVQREDLDPIEEAFAYESLKKEFSLTQEEIASRVGKSRAAVANMIRLLGLPEKVQAYIRQGRITPGHARTILREKSGSKQIELAEKMIGEGWTVRQSEKRTSEKRTREKKNGEKDPFVHDAEQQLMKHFQTRVEIRGKVRGEIRLHFHSENELIRIVEKLKGGRNAKNR